MDKPNIKIMGYNTPAYKNRHITVYKLLQHTHFKVPPPTLYFNHNIHMYLNSQVWMVTWLSGDILPTVLP